MHTLNSMSELNRSVRIEFRFHSLDGDTATQIVKMFGKDCIGARKLEDSERFVARINLTEDLDYAKLISFVRQRCIPPTEFDTSALIVTQSYADEVEMPQYALDLIKAIGGMVGFSFVAVGPSDDNGE